MRALIVLGSSLGIFLVAVVLGVMGHLLISYAVWLRDHFERRRISPSASLELRGFPAAFAREGLWELIAIGMYPFGLFERRLRRIAPAQGHRPVLLVHGYTQNWFNFVFLARRLHRAGFGPIYSVNLKPDFASMDRLGQRLSRSIDRALAASGATELDIVAHSMGGLVARLVMAWDAGQIPAPAAHRHAQRIRRLITLGTPHKGTRMADLAIGPNGRAMRRNSEFISSLPRLERGRIVCVRSRHDNVAVPHDRASVGEDAIDHLFDGIGHFGLLVDRRVADIVAAALNETDTRSGANGAPGSTPRPARRNSGGFEVRGPHADRPARVAAFQIENGDRTSLPPGVKRR